MFRKSFAKNTRKQKFPDDVLNLNSVCVLWRFSHNSRLEITSKGPGRSSSRGRRTEQSEEKGGRAERSGVYQTQRRATSRICPCMVCEEDRGEKGGVLAFLSAGFYLATISLNHTCLYPSVEFTLQRVHHLLCFSEKHLLHMFLLAGRHLVWELAESANKSSPISLWPGRLRPILNIPICIIL